MPSKRRVIEDSEEDSQHECKRERLGVSESQRDRVERDANDIIDLVSDSSSQSSDDEEDSSDSVSGCSSTYHSSQEVPNQAAEESQCDDPQQEPSRCVPYDHDLGTMYRRWTLLTLDHLEHPDRVHVTPAVMFDRILTQFKVVRYAAAVEPHDGGGTHIHICVEANDVSKNNGTTRFRKLFPEWPGRTINVRFHKCWLTMLKYASKHDVTMDKMWFSDSYSREDAALEMKGKTSKTVLAINAAKRYAAAGKDFSEMVNDPDYAPFMLRNYSSSSQFYTACLSQSEQPSTMSIIQQLGRLGDKLAAQSSMSPEQITSLDTFISQLKGRKHRQTQLYCVGPSGTGKTYLFELLARHTRCFIPCLENKERAFSGYNDSMHDWILINDFNNNIQFQLFANLCEGAMMTLNAYGHQKVKRKNVPIVITANERPAYPNLPASRVQALYKRLNFHEFSTEFEMAENEMTIENLCAYLTTLI